VMNNPWEPAKIERIESTLNVQYTRDVWRLRGAELLDEEVDAGQRARIALHLSPYAGPDTVRTIEVPMAPELAGSTVELEILPGYEVTPDLAPPDDLTALMANEQRQNGPAKSVVVQYRVSSQGVTFGGHVAQRLPDFALDALRPTHGSLSPDPFVSYARTMMPLDRYLDGHDKVRVKVREVVR